MSHHHTDLKFMKAALKLSTKARGRTEPNPMVGAVVVKDGQIIATGYHRRRGTAHAEQIALRDINTPGTTLYVSLEPCVHFGNTPPCTDLILEKKVARVVVPIEDPNPKVSGKGILKLRQHHVTVDVGPLASAATKINRHYIKYITGPLPYVALHGGVSIDGKLTDQFRQSQWITPPLLRNLSHNFRNEFSAIMAGSKTIQDDNPRLTYRQPTPPNHDPKTITRVVLDSNNTLAPHLNIFKDQDQFPLVIFSSTTAPNQTPKTPHHFFVDPDPQQNGLDLEAVLKQLHHMGIASVLVEGGGHLLNSFISRGLHDEILLFTADTLIGGKDSVQLFDRGVPVSTPVQLKHRDIIPFETGYLIRGYKD